MKTISHIMNTGVSGLPENDARRIRILNVLSMITVSVSSVYLAYYLYSRAIAPSFINTIAILSYLYTLRLTSLRSYRMAKIWIFSVHMTHVAVLVIWVYSRNTGFHFYFFSIPALAFLVFEYENMLDKLVLSCISIVLFFICEMNTFGDPLIPLPHEVNRILRLTSILTVFIGLMFVIFLFTYNIKLHEDAQGNLIRELRKALSEVKTLRGFLPICASCKKIRDDRGYWNQLELYIRERSEAEFSHSICPECAEKLYPELSLYPDNKKK